MPLNVVQGEVATNNINQNNNIKGIKLPNKAKETKISQYINVSVFYLRENYSIQTVLNYFENLQKATGATINLEKSTILPVNNNHTNKLKQNLNYITIKSVGKK